MLFYLNTEQLNPVGMIFKQPEQEKTNPKTAKVMPTVGGKPVTIQKETQHQTAGNKWQIAHR